MKKYFVINLVIIAFLACSSKSILGQSGAYNYEALKEVTPAAPPSPTVAGFAKYGAWPISYYRGTPDISVPLANFSVADYTLPISLSYHASGIRVNDIASWVGLGWSLNAGGVISVSVRGVPDFGFILPPNEEPSQRLRIRSSSDIANLDFFTEDEFRWIDGNIDDAEPDIYNFSFGGYSGQFVIDNSHNVHFLTNHSGVSISIDIPGKRITAKDQFGRSYVFSEVELTKSKPLSRRYDARFNTSLENSITPGDEKEHISAFYLSEIILENNKGSVLFEYENEISTYFTELSGKMSTTDSGGNLDCGFYPMPSNPAYWREIGQYIFSYQRITHNAKRLKKIFTNRNNAYILFQANLNREDMSGTKAMTLMSVFKDGSTVADLQWEFNYNYFLSPNTKTDGHGNALHKRLRLGQVQKKAAGLVEQPYTFAYFGDVEVDLKLPYRTSFDGIDHWGYNNADARTIQHENFSKIFPTITTNDVKPFHFVSAHRMFNNYLNPIMEMPFLWGTMPAYNGGNKTPNGHFAKAFTIKNIQYPTGGSSNFEFEGHIYSAVNTSTFGPKPCGGLRIQSITDQTTGYLPITRSFTYGQGVINQEPSFTRAFPQACIFTSTGSCRMGIVVGNIDHYTPSDEAQLWGFHLFSNSINPIYSYNSDYIGYNMVTESVSGGGRTSYIYRSANSVESSNRYSFHVGYNTFYSSNGASTSWVKLQGYINNLTPVYPFTSQITGPLYSRGQLLKKQNYNEAGIKVSEDEYEYQNIAGPVVYGNKVYITNPCGEPYYYFAAYEIHTGKGFLEQKRNYTFFGNDTIKEIVSYEYFQDYELIKSTSSTNSKGENLKIQYTYPFSYPDQTSEESHGNRTPIHLALKTMSLRHMHAYPIERLFSVNNSWKNGDLRLYRLVDNKIVILSDYQYKQGTPQTSSQAFNGRVENTTYFNKVLNYDIFDNFGNLLQYHKENNISNAYVWGYNKTLPIAKVENATHDRIAYSSFENGQVDGGWTCGHGQFHADNFAGKSSFEPQGSNLTTKNVIPAGTYRVSLYAKNRPGFSGGAVTLVGFSSVSPFWPGATSWNLGERTITLSSPQQIQLQVSGSSIMIDEIRLYPVDALMTTYTHDPLVGVTSITDPRGITTRYKYDGFGRLESISDHQKKLLEEYEYHYKTP